MSGTQAHHAGGTRARIGRAATGVVSSAAQFGSDRADIADSMGHTAAEMAGRAGPPEISSWADDVRTRPNIIGVTA